MSIAFFFFYIQHQYPRSYWSSNQDFDFIQASLKGSSFLVLPRWLHWCTGNIGYHHIHHLCTQIPNYMLPKAHDVLQPTTEKLYIKDLVYTFEASLWDSKQKKMIPFSEL